MGMRRKRLKISFKKGFRFLLKIFESKTSTRLVRYYYRSLKIGTAGETKAHHQC